MGIDGFWDGLIDLLHTLIQCVTTLYSLLLHTSVHSHVFTYIAC
jgi:hypothetical protein